ncbi:NAD(P)/FAD-dependent oxidoreductase, partial [Escherichia coli]|uniref:NAD(P)/FAD-dependent oxidoreductase n=1 Tax=Escherichia coli TaxID=562 RepID=UPI003AF1F364
TPPMEYQYVGQAPADLPEGSRPVVIGFGPCGLFAALILAQMGFRPIILERGRVVRERTKDTWGLWRKNTLQPESNVQFGEGGAGTFSDGKLSTQVKDPKHYGRKVLQEFVAADAPPEILYVSKPHIGTFRLVKMIEQMRAQIASLGGEFRFESGG